MNRIASSTPGRIRIRDLALRNPSRMEAVERTLGALDGVNAVECKPAAASVIVHFDSLKVDLAAFEHRIDVIVDAALAAPGKPGRHRIRRQVNRAAKIGMLGSLGASLVLAATGNKRWHAVSGGVFVACLGLHLGLHRKALLR
jgi:hypothetical protein